MVVPNANLDASATMDFKPQGSQIVLLGLIVSAVLALLTGGWLTYHDKSSAWIFVTVAIALFGSVVWCWKTSHRDADLENSHPTTIGLPDGTSLSTDSRLLSSPQGFKNFADALSSLAQRSPLPEPAGLVGPNGLAIPDSKQAAVERVESLNADSQRFHNEVISALQETLNPTIPTQVIETATVPPAVQKYTNKLNSPIEQAPPPSNG